MIQARSQVPIQAQPQVLPLFLVLSQVLLLSLALSQELLPPLEPSLALHQTGQTPSRYALAGLDRVPAPTFQGYSRTQNLAAKARPQTYY